jgi:hypothetical protein
MHHFGGVRLKAAACAEGISLTRIEHARNSQSQSQRQY